MASGGLKRGEKILFGVFVLFGIFAVTSFIMMEWYRHQHLDKPMYAATTHYDFSEEGLRGSVLVRKNRCTSCHSALRNGTNMGLSLDGIGSRRSFDYLLNFLKNPEATYQTQTVDHGAAPKEAAYVSQLPAADLHAMATFLSELRADRGSPVGVAPAPEDNRSGFIDEMVKVWAPGTWKSEYKDVREDTKTEKEESSNATGK